MRYGALYRDSAQVEALDEHQKFVDGFIDLQFLSAFLWVDDARRDYHDILSKQAYDVKGSLWRNSGTDVNLLLIHEIFHWVIRIA